MASRNDVDVSVDVYSLLKPPPGVVRCGGGRPHLVPTHALNRSGPAHNSRKNMKGLAAFPNDVTTHPTHPPHDDDDAVPPLINFSDGEDDDDSGVALRTCSTHSSPSSPTRLDEPWFWYVPPRSSPPVWTPPTNLGAVARAPNSNGPRRASAVGGAYSRREYLAPLEHQLAGEASLEAFPAGVCTTIAEYMIPRVVLVMGEAKCVVTRAPCALFARSPLSPPPPPPLLSDGTRARSAIFATSLGTPTLQRDPAPETGAAAFTLLHVLDMPSTVGCLDTHSRVFIEGAAALTDADPASLHRPGVGAGACLANSRRQVWTNMGERVDPLSRRYIRHQSWRLVASTPRRVGDRGDDEDDGGGCDVVGSGGNGVEDVAGCELRWLAGPRLETLSTTASAVQVVESLATVTMDARPNGLLPLLYCAALTSTPAGTAATATAAGSTDSSAAGTAGDVVAAASSLDAKWSEWTAGTAAAAPIRLLAWRGKLHVYSFEVTRQRSFEDTRQRLQLFVAAPATHPGWTAHRRPWIVSHVPDVFVVAPADATGEARVLALGGKRYTHIGEYPIAVARDAIAVARDPLSEWTICEWRLPFDGVCTAAAFADDWLYVVCAHNGAWATRWTPHHECWSGPRWVRLPGGRPSASAAILVL